MFRASQRLCLQALASPGGPLPSLRNGAPSIPSIPSSPPPSPFRSALSSTRPRYFTTSHPLRTQPSSFKTFKRSKPLPPGPNAPTVTTTATPTPTHAAKPRPDHEVPLFTSEWLIHAAINASLWMVAGMLVAALIKSSIGHKSLPPPGSDKDLAQQEKIQARGRALPLVKELSADPSWTSWDAYAGIATTAENDYHDHDDGDKYSSSASAGAVGTGGGRLSAAQSRITSGPMSGSSGLAFQRIFHNVATGEVVSVVYFGAGLAGWPGVVHGGAIATLLDESLGRCAILRFPSRTGVTANLELQYRAPTKTDTFYVIRAAPVASEDDHVVGKDGVRKGDRKLWVNGTLATEDGKVSVEAKALFVVPRAYKLRPLVEGF
ncbi:hypothetical protein GGR51DRAFT_499476 [Nemania sp. FL0031]|nr:hypothetical protein GGR51DRAFT_499476 [Nemania sp. FL0031]